MQLTIGIVATIGLVIGFLYPPMFVAVTCFIAMLISIMVYAGFKTGNWY
jgi:hypothetical protein